MSCGCLNRERAPINERFWPKVDKRGPNECWPFEAKWFNGGGA